MEEERVRLCCDSSTDPGAMLAAYKEYVARDFYEADAYIRTSAGRVSVLQQRTVLGDAFICETRHTGPCILGVKRSLKVVREDPADLVLLWLPVEGDVAICQNHQWKRVAPNNVAITYSQIPLQIETFPSKGERHTSYLVGIHHSRIAQWMPDIEYLCGTGVPITSGSSAVAFQIFRALYENAGEMSARAVDGILDAALSAIAECFRNVRESRAKRIDLKQAWLELMLRYMGSHSTEYGLTAQSVANACGISTRYLHWLFKEVQGQSFREYCWERRLMLAHGWLQDDQFSHMPISQIAAKAGFGSPAHFSRAVKQRFGRTPTELRKEKRGERFAPALDVH